MGVVWGTGTAAEESVPVYDGLLPQGRLTEPLSALAARESLAPEENFKLLELGRVEHISQHLVWIRDREQPHRHDRHDLVAIIVRGSGKMRLGDEERAVGEGSILYIPRGTVHAFRNESGQVAMAYAIYTPAFDGQDRILTQE